jgi:serine/threonine protein kinase
MVSEALVGETVDIRYELRRLIARGGMGLVYEASHKFTRRSVALKLLPEDVRTNEGARGRLLREAHAYATVRHHGFVEVLDAGVCTKNGPYLVMEMLDGRTLDGILAGRGRLPWQDIVQVGRQICDAVAHANARGVLHRDLKPSNIFLARDDIGEETVKVIDLGVAAVAEGLLEQRDQKLTQVHEVLGTPEYMAPEQLWGREIDARTDVYAIGMTLYECLTGEVPYSGTYPEVLVQVANAEGPPSVRDKRPELPAALGVVIETALEKQASERFHSAAELGRALVAASGLAPVRSSLLTRTAAQVDEEDGGLEQAIELTRKKAPRKDGVPSSKPPVTHRRHHVRAPYVTPVSVYTSSGSEITARSEEISEDGMLIVSPLPLALGTALRVRFASPVSGEITVVEASVRWTREVRGGRSALGLEFVAVPKNLRDSFADYIATALHAAHG